MNSKNRSSRREFVRTIGLLSAGAAVGTGSLPSALLAATQDSSTVVVYRNGRIYTVNPRQPWAEAVAVIQGRIVAVGTNEDVQTFASKNTKVIDLKDAFVFPGIHDCHCHPHFIYRDTVADRLSISVNDSQDTVLNKIADYAKSHDDDWIVGGLWNIQKFDGGRLTSAMLEKVAPGRPVWLKDSTGHNAAASTKALELAGITDSTPSPAGGFIEKDSNGKLTGFVSDNASAMVGGVIPGPPLDVYQRCMPMALDEMRANGITALTDMAGREPIHETYRSLDQAGELNLRVNVAVGMNSFGRNGDGHWETHPQEFLETVDRYNSRLVDARNLKYWADGTPAGLSSLMLDPYKGAGVVKERGPDYHGETTWSKADTESMYGYDRRGFRLHIHTVGDGTTSEVLDVFEGIRKANPRNTVRHHIGHLWWISDEDLQRMKRLNLSAEISPDIAYPNDTVAAMESNLEKGAANEAMPAKLFFDAGLHPAFGSDWGSSGRGYDMMATLEALVTRSDPWLDNDIVLGAGQIITLDRAIRMLTINGAMLMQHEHERGSLQVGKYADMVVVSGNPFDLVKSGNANKISDLKVLKTVFEGNVSHENS